MMPWLQVCIYAHLALCTYRLHLLCIYYSWRYKFCMHLHLCIADSSFNHLQESEKCSCNISTDMKATNQLQWRHHKPLKQEARRKQWQVLLSWFRGPWHLILGGFDYAPVATTEVILFYPDSQGCYKKTKGMLEVKPVIAVTGSGQKIRPPLATPALNTLMAQTELGSEISLLQRGLSSGPHLLFFLPLHPQARSLLHDLFPQTN